MFDFNGDGAAEVVYNDECYFHVYDGATGGLYLALPSLSRTIIENPVVSDVDNDGNAQRVPVKLGKASVDRIVVLAGLEPGERVIVSDVAQYARYDRLNVE